MRDFDVVKVHLFRRRLLLYDGRGHKIGRGREELCDWFGFLLGRELGDDLHWNVFGAGRLGGDGKVLEKKDSQKRRVGNQTRRENPSKRRCAAGVPAAQSDGATDPP